MNGRQISNLMHLTYQRSCFALHSSIHTYNRNSQGFLTGCEGTAGGLLCAITSFFTLIASQIAIVLNMFLNKPISSPNDITAARRTSARGISFVLETCEYSNGYANSQRQTQTEDKSCVDKRLNKQTTVAFDTISFSIRMRN